MIAIGPRKAKRRNETAQLTHPIVVALNKLPGVWAARNNNGHAVTRNGCAISYGLGIGSADVIGVRKVDVYGVTDKTVTYCLFFALEVKWPGKSSSPTQRAWQARLRDLGATVAVVHSVEEAVGVVGGMIF